MRHFCRALRQATAGLAALTLIVPIATENARRAGAQDRPSLLERPALESPKLPFTYFLPNAATTSHLNDPPPSPQPAVPRIVAARKVPPDNRDNEVTLPTIEILPSREAPEAPQPPQVLLLGPTDTPKPSVWQIYLEPAPEPTAGDKDAPRLAPPEQARCGQTADAVTAPRPIVAAESAPPLTLKAAAPTQPPAALAPIAAPQNQSPVSVAQPGLLEAKVRWANASVRSACDLGERRLLYSTRAKLQDALYQLAQSLDETAGTKRHAASLDAALEALREADDFFPRRSGLPFATDTARIAAGHRSPAASSLPPDSSVGQAIRHYYGFAKEQLTAAFAEVPAASGAMWGLGKAYVEFSREPDSLVVNGQGKALVFQEAAVAVDPANWRAANELGVLLARAGRWQDAAVALHKSLALQGTAEGWHNLAVVSEQLGQSQEAQAAQQRSTAMGYRGDRSDKPTVEWVPPAALGVTAGPHNATAAGEKANAAARTVSSDSTEGSARPTTARRLFDWLPWRSAN